MRVSRLVLVYFGIGIVFILNPILLRGQFAQRIRTARPSVTMGTYTVGQDVLQWQTGVSWQDLQADHLDRNTIQYKTVLRWGFLEKWEMSGVINYQRDWNKAPIHSNHQGIHALRLGIRHHLFEKAGFLKAAAIQGRLWFPFVQEDYQQEQLGGRIMASVSYRLIGQLQLITNGGWKWNGKKPSKALSFFSLRFSHPLGRKFSLVMDYFGGFQPFEPDYAIGIGYFINSSWKLDIAVGSLGESLNHHRYLEVGGATRIDWRR